MNYMLVLYYIYLYYHILPYTITDLHKSSQTFTQYYTIPHTLRDHIYSDIIMGTAKKKETSMNQFLTLTTEEEWDTLIEKQVI